MLVGTEQVIKGRRAYSVHATNKCRTGKREGVSIQCSVCRPRSVVAISGVSFDTGEDEEKDDGDTHASSREHGHERDML